MKNFFRKTNQAGTMLVEAMAMLGLIAMVTPILYKKAAERTTELQDINASNQLRVLSGAMDSYIKDNFARITRGETITNSCSNGNDSVDYSAFAGENVTEGTVSMSLAHLCEYLPYGFLDSNGRLQNTKMFSADNNDSFRVIVKLEGNNNDDNKTITGFVTAVPRDENSISASRASRIATMVGSNGGYIDQNGEAMGAQGIWSIDNPGAELGVNLPENSFVVASVQPISSQGLANEDVLHRKSEPDNDDILNTMETDLYMGFSDQPNNIRLVNQIIMVPNESRMVMADDETDTKGVPNSSQYSEGYKPELQHALYIGNGGGTYMEGALAAMDSIFTVDDGGIAYYGANEGGNDPATGAEIEASRGDKVFGVTSEALEYGNIAGKDGSGATASNLFSVSTDVLKYGAPSFNAGGGEGGTEATPAGEQELIYADRNKVNLGNRALQVTSEAGTLSTGEQWSGKTNPWKVVVGEGNAHNEAYTEYTYDASGNAGNGNEIGAQDYAMTVNGPAFIKDTLRTGKLRSRDVDAAKLRAGADPDTYNTAVNDEDFYNVVEHERMLVGKEGTDAASTYRMQIAESDDEANNIAAGIHMRHESGITMAAGENDTKMVSWDGTTSDRAQNNQISLQAEDEIALGTFDSDGFPTGGSVSLQGNIMRAYHSSAGEGSDNILDSVVKEYTIAADDNDLPNGELSYYDRDTVNGNVRLGGINMNIQNVDEIKGRPVFDVSPDVLDDENEVVSKLTGSLAVYDRDYDHYVTADKTDRHGNVLPQGYAAMYVNKGDFSILATEDKETEDIRQGDVIFQVDNNSENINVSTTPEEDRRGSLYVRKGALSLATDTETAVLPEEGLDGNRSRITHNTISDNYVDPAQAIGYISADRFVANVQPVDDALEIGARTDFYKNLVTDGADAYYDKFEVNPAYTSVMHDIKLTTRGGARLSDILPDFINKGIYVVDNTYNPNLNWANNGFDPRNLTEWNSAGSNGRVETSAFLGLVPTPQCPPQYVKVVTLTPASWAMAQAGTPAPEFKNLGSVGDILTHNDPYQYYYTDSSHTMLREDSQEKSSPRPLTFQKSTWLKGMVVPACPTLQYNGSCNGNKDFIGWGTALGFIYPYNYYRDFLSGAHGASGYETINDDDNSKVFWNLYPVYKKELEAYATVYCYFARKGKNNDGSSFEIYNENYVDVDYDQLNNPRPFYDKDNSTYTDRLNDPALKYKDPW